MGIHVRGDETYHGAQTSDVGCAVGGLSHALYNQSRCNATTATINSDSVLISFSMGGIIVAKYAAQAREYSNMTRALLFTGSPCTARILLNCPPSKHSVAVWQPALAWRSKATIV